MVQVQEKGTPSITHGFRLIKGNDVSDGIPKDASKPFIIASRHGGQVVTYTFESTDPNSKLIFVNKVEFDGKDLTVHIYNLSGGPINNVKVTGWEVQV